jgi:hypothetical protein
MFKIVSAVGRSSNRMIHYEKSLIIASNSRNGN